MINFNSNYEINKIDDLSIIFLNEEDANLFVKNFNKQHKENLERYLEETNIFDNNGIYV